MPVGTYIGLNAMDPGGGWTIDPATIKWDGGTDYVSYFDDNATSTVAGSPWLQSVSLEKGVAKNQPLYSFLLGAEQKQYTITLNCSYYNPNGGADIQAPPTTLNFTAVRPTTASLTGLAGKITFTGPSETSNNAVSSYINPAMKITATVQTGEFGGDFMFLQLANWNRTKTLNSGTVQKFVNLADGNNNVGPNLDDGIKGSKYANSTVAYFSTYPSNPDNPLVSGWPEAENMTANQTSTMVDRPTMGVDTTQYTAYTAGDSFQTYLMYRPPDGAWVALAEYDWSWSANASAPWPAQSDQAAPAGANKQPAGDAAFPGWTNNTSSIDWQ